MKKLIPITSINQLKVDDILIRGGSNSTYRVLAICDNVVALSDEKSTLKDIYGWYVIKELELHFRQEVEEVKWKPEYEDKYYYVDLNCDDNTDWVLWRNDKSDIRNLERGLCFKTPQEASAAVEKMLKALNQ